MELHAALRHAGTPISPKAVQISGDHSATVQHPHVSARSWSGLLILPAKTRKPSGGATHCNVSTGTSKLRCRRVGVALLETLPSPIGEKGSAKTRTLMEFQALQTHDPTVLAEVFRSFWVVGRSERPKRPCRKRSGLMAMIPDGHAQI